MVGSKQRRILEILRHLELNFPLLFEKNEQEENIGVNTKMNSRTNHIIVSVPLERDFLKLFYLFEQSQEGCTYRFDLERS